MERRNFIENLAKGAGSLIILPPLLTSCADDPIDDPNGNQNGFLVSLDLADSQNAALASAGGFLIRNNIIIINTGSNYVALSSVCTHSGCQVTYSSGENNLPCPCHGSLFSISGTVLNGPADAPLQNYLVSLDGDMLRISAS